MKSKKSLPILLVLAVLLISGFLFSNWQGAKAVQTERGFVLFFKYPSVTVARKEKIDLDFMVINTGKREEEVFLSIIPDKKAKDWNVGFETRWDKMQVHSVGLLTKEPDNSVTLRFYAIPPDNAKEGEYRFVVKGTSLDRKIQRSASLLIHLVQKGGVKEEVSKEIELTSDYPSMENPAGKDFKFAIKVKNNTDKPVVLDIGADFPYGWTAYCSPRWEEEKKISSIKVDEKQTENLLLTLTPPPTVSKGEYPIKFAVRSGEKVVTIDLKAIITGTYKLKMRTETGRLNLDAIAGKKENINVYLWNEGSAPVEDVSFFSLDTPKGWKVSFEPEKVSSVSPYQEVRKPDKVKISILPPPRTIPGDYMFTVRAAGKQDQTDMDLRVTVKRSTVWGWVGIGIVVVIIASLVGIFVKLGRR
ncbi:hypothetical protein J7K97_05700 [Candidatus Aerophobetes bacterium]|nr:hypothetical protein [Candidatus Aerophobetes bacterium]